MLEATWAFDDLHQWIEQEQVMGAPEDHHFDWVDLHSPWSEWNSIVLVSVRDHRPSWGLLMIRAGTGLTTFEYIAQHGFPPLAT